MAGTLRPVQSAFGWTTDAVKDVARGDVIGVSYPYAVATAAGIGLKHVCAVCLAPPPADEVRQGTGAGAPAVMICKGCGEMATCAGCTPHPWHDAYACSALRYLHTSKDLLPGTPEVLDDSMTRMGFLPVGVPLVQQYQ